MIDYNMLSNAEIRIRLTEMENKYEAIKKTVKDNLEEMQRLDNEYVKAKQILQKRTKGRL